MKESSLQTKALWGTKTKPHLLPLPDSTSRVPCIPSLILQSKSTRTTHAVHLPQIMKAYQDDMASIE